MAEKRLEQVIFPGEIAEKFEKIMTGGKATNQRREGEQASTWKSGQRDYWVGSSGEEMRGWLAEGFYPPEDGPAVDFGDAERLRRRLQMKDEGELLYDLALSGADYPFLEWEKRPVKRGLRIQPNITFNCGTPNKVIAEYLEWVLKLIDAAELRGYSPEVEAVIEVNDVFSGRSGDILKIRIPLKQAMYANDVVSWRAFFTPAGFRMLGFLAIMIAGEREGAQVDYGFGYPTNNRLHQWEGEYTSEDGTLALTGPGSASDFPADKFNKLVESEGVLGYK